MGNSHRHRLQGAIPRQYRDHRARIARRYRVAYVAFSKEFIEPAPGSALSIDMARAARAWAELQDAQRALDEARAKVEAGGKGNSRAALARLERRAWRLDNLYGAAREQLDAAGRRALAKEATTTTDTGKASQEPRRGGIS